MIVASMPRLARACCGWVGLACLLVGAAVAQPVTQPFTFSPVPNDLPHLRHGAVAWGDYDGDGDLDAFVSGESEGQLIARLYRNDGKVRTPGASATDSSAVFADVGATLTPVAYARTAWGDYDGDQDLDLVVQGSRTTTAPYDPVTTLYRNDGGTFAEVAGPDLMGVHSGTLAWGDYDNDGDLDLLLSGETAAATFATTLYRNDGGTFEATDAPILGMAYGQADWGDYDTDGDLDLLLAGATDEGFVNSGRSDVYRNDNGNFTALGTGLVGALAGTSTWGDYDNDGDLDVFVLGAEEALGRRTAQVYRNDGGSTFTSVTLLVGVVFAAADWGDYDGDGDLDLLASGFASDGLQVTQLYENLRQVRPPSPDTPSSLQAKVTEQTVALAWTPADATLGFTYNLRVGTTPGGSDVMAAQADAETGYRLINRPGNAQQHTAWTLRDLPAGTYYWSVQAVNAAYQPSTFAPEQTFTVTAATSTADEGALDLPTVIALGANYPNPFGTRTTIPYELPQTTAVTLRVFNLLGQEVTTLVDGTVQAGRHVATWTPDHLAPGLYLYELQAGGATFTGKMLWVR